jgi:RNA polymerase sigma factor (sigma-70 family)
MLKDQDIIKGCQNFNPISQKALYEKFASKMFGVCLRYAANREEAKDLLHEGFLKIFTCISQYRNEGSLEGWVRRIMVTTSLLHLRKKKKLNFENIDGKSSYQYDNLEDENYDLDEIKNRDFTEEELLSSINILPDINKIVFNLYYIEKYSHKEIGELLGINEVTSRTRLLRSRKIMQEYLRQLSDEKLKVNSNNSIHKSNLL